MRIISIVSLLAVTTSGAWAQQGQTMSLAESLRDAQMRKLEVERSVLLAMVDSMPERLFADRATPAQRDFAEQIHHAATAAAFISARFMAAGQPELPDTTGTLHTRDGLKRIVNSSYDFATKVLREQSEDDRISSVGFFGQQIPKWQVWDEIHQHTMWTVGQVVANFRKHGMAPPGFTFF